jgi:RNA polymerase-associated protein
MGIVAKRSSMTFYSDPTCHYSHRVRIVLAEKGVTVDIEDIDNQSIPEEIMAINPYGTLPTLIDRDLALYETKVMMEYLDERFPHPPLLPVYPVARALNRQYIYRIEKDCSSQIDLIINTSDTQVIDGAKKELQDSLISLAPIFTDLPFFMSEHFTLVDCCLGPILWRLKSLNIDIPDHRQTKPLFDYMNRIFERESFQESLSEFEGEL